jgi:hypothetical protein
MFSSSTRASGPSRRAGPCRGEAPLLSSHSIDRLTVDGLRSIGQPINRSIEHHPSIHIPPSPKPSTDNRGSLESTLAELNGVVRGIDEAAGGSWEPEPDNPLRRPYWLLRLIRQTVRHGGFITPRLHVPALVWKMYGASFSGLSVKTKAFESVLILLVDRVLPLEMPRGPHDMARARHALRVLEGVRTELDQLQCQLARPFPFIREVPTTASSGGRRAASTAATAGVAEGSGIGGLNHVQQRLSSMVLSIGKHVKKSAAAAATAYERIGALIVVVELCVFLVCPGGWGGRIGARAGPVPSHHAHTHTNRRGRGQQDHRRGACGVRVARPRGV